MSRSTALTTTSLLGIGSSLFIAGTNFSASHLTLPILYRLPDATGANIFSELFQRGAKTLIPLISLSTLSTGVAAYLDPERRVGYSIAAALTITPLAWTRIAMMPAIDRLLHINETKAEKVEKGEVEVLLRRWKWMNMVRAGLSLAGGAVALLSFATI